MGSRILFDFRLACADSVAFEETSRSCRLCRDNEKADAVWWKSSHHCRDPRRCHNQSNSVVAKKVGYSE